MNKLIKQSIEEKNQSDNIESYTAMMSHEFRTPLSTVLMLLENILGMIQDEAISSFIKLIQLNLWMLTYLVNDILDLKQIKEGNFEAIKNCFNPQDAIMFVHALYDQ